MSDHNCCAFILQCFTTYSETCQYEDEEDEDDDDVLARVLAQSQAEYLDSLKSAHSASKSTTATNDMPAETDTTSGDYISNQPSTSNYRS